MKTIKMENQTDKLKTSMLFIIKAIIVFLFIAWNMNSFAQDTILLKDNSFYHGKVKEVSRKEVIYTNTQNNSDELIAIDIFLVKSIRYENGMIENYLNEIPKGYYLDNNMNLRNAYNGDVIKVGENEMVNKMMDVNNPDINYYLEESKKSKRSQKQMIAPIAGFGGGAAGFAVLATLMEFWSGGGSDSQMALAVSGGCLVLSQAAVGAAFYFNAKDKNNKKAAIKKYNELYSNTY